MSRAPSHPAIDQVDLPMVLDCLSDPIRLAIVSTLASGDGSAVEMRCGDFNFLSGKSNLAYHFVKLREAGVVWTRLAGTHRYMRLRREELDARFPGLLDAIISAAAPGAELLRADAGDLLPPEACPIV